jgi:hypothetical protein
VNLANHFVKNVINNKLVEMNCGKRRTMNFIILDFLAILYGSMIVVGKYVIDMAPIDLANLSSVILLCSTLIFSSQNFRVLTSTIGFPRHFDMFYL